MVAAAGKRGRMTGHRGREARGWCSFAQQAALVKTEVKTFAESPRRRQQTCRPVNNEPGLEDPNVATRGFTTNGRGGEGRMTRPFKADRRPSRLALNELPECGFGGKSGLPSPAEKTQQENTTNLVLTTLDPTHQ